jgi:hypothetical protein
MSVSNVAIHNTGSRDRRTRLRKARALIALTLLPLSACNTAWEWLAGINPNNYTWDPPIGAAPAAGTMEKDLKARPVEFSAPGVAGQVAGRGRRTFLAGLSARSP